MQPTLSRAESPWAFFDPGTAPGDGPIAFGDDLRPSVLLDAYQRGLFPFPAATVEQALLNEVSYEAEVRTGRVRVLDGAEQPYAVAWCSPDPRPLIPVDQARIQRSLRQQLRNRASWTTTLDACFPHVVARCREGRSERWLTDALVESLGRLHEDGHAHSVEVWNGDELVGGMFGVRSGAVFSADSQFTTRSGAGKVAVLDLVRRFADAGGAAVDVQWDSAHVRLLGARPVPRNEYLEMLRRPVPSDLLPVGLLPARRLAD